MAKWIGAAAFLLAGLPSRAQTPDADALGAALRCRLTNTDFVYHCLLRLTKSGKPLSHARVVLGADMPSMPGAHTVVPVNATPGKAPGEYRATLDLEMLGEWAVRVRVSGPSPDKRERTLVLHYEFNETGATRSGKPHRK